MELDTMRTLIHSTPGPTAPDIDAQAREWLGKAGFQLTSGDGDPVVLVVFGRDYDSDIFVYALPASGVDEQAHEDLAKVTGAFFEFHFGADLKPEQFAGALRICGGTTDEPDVFEEQLDDVRGDLDGVDVDALLAAAGSWEVHRVDDGATLSGPISHVYSANLCM
jgi:hypothetical protein